jgi:hypothetical protein
LPANPIDVSNALSQQNGMFTRGSTLVFLFRGRRRHHCTDAWFATLPSEQRPQQRFAINRISLGAPSPSRDRNRCRVDSVALDLVRLQQPMHPEPIQAGLVNNADFDWYL